MVSSVTEICNSALIKLGHDRIADLTDDTKAARLLNEQYPKIRDKVIAGHPWNFAIARVETAADVDVPMTVGETEDFTHQHTLPNDVLRVLETDIPFPENWVVEQGKILCHTDSLKIKYIKQITDVSKFPPVFAEALAWQLASDICYNLTQNATLTASTIVQASKELAQARSFDAQEGRVRQVQASEWFDRRY